MDATVIALVRTALSVVNQRLLTIMGLWMVFGLALWAMYVPTLERIYIAGGFALLVYLPSVFKETSYEGRKRQEHENGAG